MSLKQIGTEITATPLEELTARNMERKEQTDNALLKEALARSSVNCNELISRQNTLIKDLTMTVNSLKSENDYNVSRLKENVSSAVVAMKNLQDETRKLNKTIATETSDAIRQTRITLESELRKSIAVQSQEVFAEVKKELDESKQLLETTREELRLQRSFRKFLFWATPILLLAQTIALIVSLL